MENRMVLFEYFISNMIVSFLYKLNPGGTADAADANGDLNKHKYSNFPSLSVGWEIILFIFLHLI